MNDALSGPVEAFIAAVAPAVIGLLEPGSTIPPAKLEGDVALEAYSIASAFIDADGLHTDEELWALIATFASRLETQLVRATPGDIRVAGLVAGKRAWLEKPSVMFSTLVLADRRDGTSHAWSYYERAMELAHVVASLDAHASHAELVAIDHFRTMLLAHMSSAGVGRPKPGVPGEPAVATGTSAPATAPPVEPELPPARPLEDLLEELDALVGLDAVKTEVRLMTNLIQVQKLRQERGLKTPEASNHLIFTGNPGTGKTTVARLLAQIYRTLGVVEKGHLIETDRSQLVAGFVGQTAIRVREVFDQADQGVLLVDEAYALIRGGENDFGREAIDTIVKLVEDRRDRVVVIAAGYPDEMTLFVEANPGLRSRFPKTIFFPDYSDDELVAIFDTLAEKAQYRLADDARDELRSLFARQSRDRGFGNGRLARNLFEQAISRQASRIVTIDEPTDDDLITLTADDLKP